MAPGAPADELTMVEAVADDTQRLVALNEIYLGPSGHQTARYRLGVADSPAGPMPSTEPQASSGVLVGTGTGATGLAALPVAGTPQRPAACPARPTPGCSGSSGRPGRHRPPAPRSSRANWAAGRGCG